MSEQDHVYEFSKNPNTDFCELCGKNISDTGQGLVSHNKKYHDNVICHICGFVSQGWDKHKDHLRNCNKKQCDNCNKGRVKKNMENSIIGGWSVRVIFHFHFFLAQAPPP